MRVIIELLILILFNLFETWDENLSPITLIDINPSKSKVWRSLSSLLPFDEIGRREREMPRYAEHCGTRGRNNGGQCQPVILLSPLVTRDDGFANGWRTIRTLRERDAISRAYVAHARRQWMLCSRPGVYRLPKWTLRETETRSHRELQITATRA